MGAFLNKPKTEKSTSSGTGKGFTYALSSMQGWRVEMEDAHCAKADLEGDFKDWSFFAVFDGHAGARVSAIASDMLLDQIIKHPTFTLKPVLSEEGKPTATATDSSQQGKMEQVNYLVCVCQCYN